MAAQGQQDGADAAGKTADEVQGVMQAAPQQSVVDAMAAKAVGGGAEAAMAAAKMVAAWRMRQQQQQQSGVDVTTGGS